MQSVWKNRDFVWLIGGQTVSEFGSSITGFALPWLLLQLTGSAMQMGFAFAVEMIPYLAVSLPAGVYADRFNRKTLMMIADSGRMILVLSIPLAHAFGALTIAQLYVVMALMGVCNAVFDSAYVACLPSVVGREHLQEANAALQSGVSASQILGPGLAGVLVGWVGTANTIFINSGSFAISVITLFLIRVPFSAALSMQKKEPMMKQIGEGLQFVWNHRLIRLISMFTLTMNLASSASSAVMMYHMQRDMHLSARWTGAVMSGFSVGTVSGSVVAGFISKRFRMGKIMAATLAFQVIPMFVYALTPWAWMLMVANFIVGFTAVNWNVQSVSLRQSVIPDHLLGRASSAIRMVVWGSMPAGSSAGGVLGQIFGAPLVFVCGGIIQAGVFVGGFFTPLFRATGKETYDNTGAVVIAASAGGVDA